MSTSRPAWATRRPSLVLALLAGLLLTALATAPAPARAAGPPALIHVNACDRAAKCRGGNATKNLTALLNARKPELLTLNEMCSATVNQVARNTGYKKVFAQAGTTTCPGDRGKYGNAIMAAPHRTLDKTVEQKFDQQQAGPEKRVVLCADSSGAAVCTSHLDHEGKAPEQARELRRVLAAQLQRNPSLFFGGDLNLRAKGAANFALPAGMRRIYDGGVMHVFYSAAFGKLAGSTIRLRWTDHPGLVLRVPAAR